MLNKLKTSNKIKTYQNLKKTRQKHKKKNK